MSEERPRSTRAGFVERANVCVDLSRTAQTDAMRQLFIEMAGEWLRQAGEPRALANAMTAAALLAAVRKPH